MRNFLNKWRVYFPVAVLILLTATTATVLAVWTYNLFGIWGPITYVGLATASLLAGGFSCSK